MGEEESQQTGWGVPSEWREAGSSFCSTSHCCLMVRICSSIPDLLGEKHHVSATGVKGELWEKLVAKPGLELDLCHRSSYTEKCLDFRTERQVEGQGLPHWQVSLRTLLPTATEMGWQHYPGQCLHFNFSLFSFISNLVLHVPHAPLLHKPCCSSLGEAMCLE